MNPTDFQKVIIDDIINNRIYDVYTFLELRTKCKARNYIWSGNDNMLLREYKNDRSNLFEIDGTDFLELSRELFEFVVLSKYLEDNRIVYPIKIELKALKPVFVFQNETQIGLSQPEEWYKVNQLILNIYKWEFFGANILEQYVNNGYLIESDLKDKNQNTHRERTLFWTRFAAISALFAFVVTIILQIVFSSKERDVIINNRNAFQDTTKIFLLNPVKSIDTNRLKDSIKK
jgi:hypothetical protein